MAIHKIIKNWRQPKYPRTDDWIKETVVNIYSRILLNSNNNNKIKLMCFALLLWGGWDLESIVLGELARGRESNTELISLMCGI